jgi:hypothetical protein
MGQPIVRGIQAVGSVDITYLYNEGDLPIPDTIRFGGSTGGVIPMNNGAGVQCVGFRLDSEFLRAVQLIASSATIPILGGGGVSLTNNVRAGTLNINSSRVGSPRVQGETPLGSINSSDAAKVGVAGNVVAYDLVILAQCQQAAAGGDSVGATIFVSFDFAGRGTKITFEQITVANVAPIALAGNNLSDYQIQLNYLNWTVDFTNSRVASA